MSIFDNYNFENERYKPDYSSVYGDGSGTAGTTIGGLLGNITQSIGDSMVDDTGLFQGGKKNRMFGRLRDWWQGDEGEPTINPVELPQGSGIPNVAPEDEIIEGAEDVNRKYPSWHPWSEGVPEMGDEDMGRVKPGQNIFARNVESGDEDMGRVAPGENVFTNDGSYQMPTYNETPYTEPTYNETPYVAPEYNETPYVAPQYNETPYVAPQHGTTNYVQPQYNTTSFNRAGSGKGSNYPYDTSNPGFQYAQTLLGSIPGYETTNPAKVDAEITDNATNVFNSTRGQNWRGNQSLTDNPSGVTINASGASPEEIQAIWDDF